MNATTTFAATQLVPLAKELDENKVTPGVLGFIVFALIGGAVWLLMKSMNKHMNRVAFKETPDPREEDSPGAGAGADAPASASGAPHDSASSSEQQG
jgi:hypothetical protein